MASIYSVYIVSDNDNEKDDNHAFIVYNKTRFFFSGRGIHEKGIKIQHIFCSPALRCVQTAVGLLRGLVFSLSQTSFTLQVYMKIIGCQTAKIGNQK